METKYVLKGNIADTSGCKTFVGKQLLIEHRIFGTVENNTC